MVNDAGYGLVSTVEDVTEETYRNIVAQLLSLISEQINCGNDPSEIARMILEIAQNDNAPARQTAGDKARKFIPMRRELSDEDFERRVKVYYGI